MYYRRCLLVFLLAMAILALLPALIPLEERFQLRRWLSERVPESIRAPFRYMALIGAEPLKSLPVPVDGVRPSSLADTWGAPRSGHRLHQGIDIFARRDTPVRSTTEGIVVKKGTNRLGGLIVTVMGPGGQIHYYAHLERYGEIAPFDWVERGEVIGYVGNSGNARSTPPHLHYGIYYGVKGAINPYPLLTEALSTTGSEKIRAQSALNQFRRTPSTSSRPSPG
ncbi:MAG: M23 family metallopeptidase [Acidobacteriota bacterium]